MKWLKPEDWQHQMMMRIWSNKNSHSSLMGMQNDTATLEESLLVSHKTKYMLTIRSDIHTPWYLPQWTENLFLYKICTLKFISVLSINTKPWKQPRCPSVGEMDKLWYIQIMEYYSVLKRNELSSHEKTLRNLQCSTKWKSQSERSIYCMIPTI